MRKRDIVTAQDGFTVLEMLVATSVLLMLMAAALGTYDRSLHLSDYATQLADANQNLRAGVGQLVRDVMQTGRIIGPQGVPIPRGSGAQPVKRPGPPGTSLTFDVTTTTNLPDITSGYHLGPTVNGVATDIITLMTIDAFMPVLDSPPSGTIDVNEATIDPDGARLTVPANSLWLAGDGANDTPPIRPGDIVLFKNTRGMALQTVTRLDSTHIYFDADDWFELNQRTAAQGTILHIKHAADTTTAWTEQTSMFRLLLTTYYVDAVSTPGSPRLMRQTNHFTPQSLSGAVEGLSFTYDLVDGTHNPVDVPSLPYTSPVTALVYNANQIRKVNISVAARSESVTRSGDYVRNVVSTSVDVRSLGSVDRYDH
jgi:prepilin-type N-terminal cleavage/methylation domain-containing protein